MERFNANKTKSAMMKKLFPLDDLKWPKQFYLQAIGAPLRP